MKGVKTCFILNIANEPFWDKRKTMLKINKCAST